jgi:hypothetical protein
LQIVSCKNSEINTSLKPPQIPNRRFHPAKAGVPTDASLPEGTAAAPLHPLKHKASGGDGSGTCLKLNAAARSGTLPETEKGTQVHKVTFATARQLSVAGKR